jgi:predicted Fe-Mo cluster-binding NifX family protein
MKIAIPVNEQSMDSEVCPSFGRTPYFLLYNSVTKESSYLNNEAAASQGGAGIRAAQAIADQGVKSLITPRCGENAVEVLKKAEVFVYRAVPGTARENIEAHLKNQLSLLEEFHAGFHGHAAK